MSSVAPNSTSRLAMIYCHSCFELPRGSSVRTLGAAGSTLRHPCRANQSVTWGISWGWENLPVQGSDRHHASLSSEDVVTASPGSEKRPRVRTVTLSFACCTETGVAQTRTVFVHLLPPQTQVSVCYLRQLLQQMHSSVSTSSLQKGRGLILGLQITSVTGRRDTEKPLEAASWRFASSQVSCCPVLASVYLAPGQSCGTVDPGSIPEAIKLQSTWSPLGAELMPGHTNLWDQRVRGMWLSEAQVGCSYQ